MAPPSTVPQQCRTHLRHSLQLTSQLLRNGTSPADALLTRMNDALGAIVVSDFGASSQDQLRRLYACIDAAQAEMMDKCENLALLYFARSLAVVLEEAVDREGVRQTERRQEKAKWEELAEERATARDCGNEKKKEEDTVVVEDHQHNEKGSVVPSLPSSPPLPEEHDPEEAWRQLPDDFPCSREKERHGVLTIEGISPHIGKEQLQSFLEMMGPVAELRHYPLWKGWLTGFAVCRYESDAAADAAHARFDRKMFFGTQLYVKRVKAPPKRESATGADDVRDADEVFEPDTDDEITALSPTNTDTVLDSDDLIEESDNDVD